MKLSIELPDDAHVETIAGRKVLSVTPSFLTSKGPAACLIIQSTTDTGDKLDSQIVVVSGKNGAIRLKGTEIVVPLCDKPKEVILPKEKDLIKPQNAS